MQYRIITCVFVVGCFLLVASPQVLWARLVCHEEDDSTLGANEPLTQANLILEFYWPNQYDVEFVQNQTKDIEESMRSEFFKNDAVSTTFEWEPQIHSLPELPPSVVRFNISMRLMDREQPGALLDIFKDIIDCTTKCIKIEPHKIKKSAHEDHSSQAPLFEFKPQESFTRKYRETGLAGQIGVQYHNEGRDSSCNLCEKIDLNQRIYEKLTRNQYVQMFLNFTETIVSLLEPHNWLKLIIASWLMVCLIIAMYIKSRDKRRLRLYLEERADYSFSAKR